MKYLSETITIDKVAESLKVNADMVKKYTKKYNIPFYKIGHQWRFDSESVELLMEKLQCRYSTINEGSIGMSKVKFGTESTSSALGKVQEAIAKELRKQSVGK